MTVLLNRYGHLTVSNLSVSPEYQFDDKVKGSSSHLEKPG